MLPLILLTVCVISQPVQAEKSVYVFGPDQSIVVKTGGFAGVHETYAVAGQFQLAVDSDAGVSSFEIVDASLTDEAGSEYGRSLDEIFNMTGLSGTILDETTIEFEGKTADGTESDVRLKLSFNDDTIHLTGKTTPPPNSADMFFYDIDAVATKKYAGGTGEPNDPYLIYTAEQMNTIGTEPVDWYKHFKLMDDIDLSPFKGADFNIIGYLRTWDNKAPFTGVFDGNNHTISNFTYVSHDSDRVGLFGYVWWAEIKNLGLIDPNVDAGTGRFVGSLAGWLGEGTISGCFVQGGTVTGGEDVGGLVGFSSGYGLGRLSNTIVNCHVTGNVIGLEHLGGLVGCNQGSTISACYSAGSVSGVGVAGGLVGDNWEGAITDCYSSCSVDGDSAGGLVGSNILGALSMCYSTGTVSGNAQVGGLVGQNGELVHIRGETLFFQGLIDNCYSTSKITGKAAIGGLVGFNEVGTITHCYSTGAVSGDERAGGLIGENNDRVTYCFWDVETSGLTVSAGGMGKTTAQMQTTETFLSWGAYGSLWTIDEGHDYPHLAWENVPGEFISAYGGGVGTANDPYLIYTAEQLNMIGLCFSHWDKHFKLMVDIDMSGFDGKDGKPPFNIIAPGHVAGFEVLDFWGTAFTGLFDGNGQTISHVTVKTNECAGLFGGLGSEGEIRNLGVVDVNIVGSSSVGGLVGFSEDGSSVSQCYSTGTVSGTYWRVGGLVGSNHGSITTSYSASTVSGDSAVGGLVGFNNWFSSVTQCYSTGEVNGDEDIGGLVGENFGGEINNSYSTGRVDGDKDVGGLVGDHFYGNISHSFWDIETSGQAISTGGAGRTTAEMQTADTFLEAGWDFVDETANGTEDIWWILEGQDYPRLWWETIEE